MKKLGIFLIVLLITTPAFAEKWICYDELNFSIVKRVQGDCLNLGVCSGANNTGIASNCFEATAQEYQAGSQFFKKINTSALIGSRVIDWTQQEIDSYIAAQASSTDASIREESKTGFDGFNSQALAYKALVEILIDEINLLRQAITEMTVETNQLTDRNLPPRTLAQAKTAIKNKIDGGTLDNK